MCALLSQVIYATIFFIDKHYFAENKAKIENEMKKKNCFVAIYDCAYFLFLSSEQMSMKFRAEILELLNEADNDCSSYEIKINLNLFGCSKETFEELLNDYPRSEMNDRTWSLEIKTEKPRVSSQSHFKPQKVQQNLAKRRVIGIDSTLRPYSDGKRPGKRKRKILDQSLPSEQSESFILRSSNHQELQSHDIQHLKISDKLTLQVWIDIEED